VTKEQGVAFIQTQVVCALAEIEGAKALNIWRESRGESIAYDEEAFLEIPKKYGLGHNEVLTFFGRWE